jgi:hypothetical protein
MTQAACMFHLVCGYRFSMPSKNIDTFDFQQLQLIDFPLSIAVSSTYVYADVWHGSCFSERRDASNQL